MTDTIVALVTPNSQSALGIIRVSGNMVLELCEKACGLPALFRDTHILLNIPLGRKYPRSTYLGLL